MSVGFGFSAGDFISALELVATVVDALRESGESSTEFQALVAQLETLQGALESVNCLEVDDDQHEKVVALHAAAAQCQRTISNFWEEIKKYQPSLRAGGSGNRFKDGWMKARWAVCKKEDLTKFRIELAGHTDSIQMLLTTVQMAATRIDDNRNHQRHYSLAGKMQESYFGCMSRIGVVIHGISTGLEQGRQLMDLTANIIQTNIQIFRIVLNLQNIITRIPGQVERQQPIYLIDALDRHMPFHLEFILSANALTSVLQSNFQTIGSGAKKIKDGEFVIHDVATKRDINLSSPWESCFAPGQRVVMSMMFNTKKALLLCCPNCKNDNNEQGENEDIQW
ncbi:hypothetical protein N431DRAFT_398375 [Stipitochalara longipes BDJ]|nr:hypothetical protein N431DRAFT_398375 [Stipitochalara longipes BDJ]